MSDSEHEQDLAQLRKDLAAIDKSIERATRAREYYRHGRSRYEFNRADAALTHLQIERKLAAGRLEAEENKGVVWEEIPF